MLSRHCVPMCALLFSAEKVSGLLAGKFAFDNAIAFEIFCVTTIMIIRDLH